MTHPHRPHLGHVHLEVRRLDRSVDFYRRLLGLEVTEEASGQFAFLSFGDHHHDLALQQITRPSEPDSGTRPGLYHVAFELPSGDALVAAARRLKEEGRPVELVDHGISHALYTRDPDGHGLELYVDRRNEPGGRSLWGGSSHRLGEPPSSSDSDPQRPG